MRKYRLIGSSILTSILVLLLSDPACSPDQTPGGQTGGGERMFVEALLKVTDAESVDATGRPIRYTLLKDKTYTLTLTAEKFTGYLDGEMRMKVQLPAEVEKTGGEDLWNGRDKQKTLSLKIRPLQEGEATVNAEAINLANNFSVTNTIRIVVVGSGENLRK